MKMKNLKLCTNLLTAVLLAAMVSGCAASPQGSQQTNPETEAASKPSGYRVGSTLSDAYVDPTEPTKPKGEIKASGYSYDLDALTYELVWSDEFDYEGKPDPAKWGYDVGGGGWGNNELQYYTNGDNAQVHDDVLTITLRKEKMGNRDYTSARLVSKGKGDWLYGKIEVAAKLPVGLGTWPAIWMLPTNWEYGGWPASGEIDIMEHVGYDQDVIVQSVHTDKNHAGRSKSHAQRFTGVSEEFHVYSVEWLPDQIIFSVDGEVQYVYDPNKVTSDPTYRQWPFDKEMHLLLNLAYGGNWGGARGTDDSCLPAEFVIDYVRVYQSPEIMEISGQQ